MRDVAVVASSQVQMSVSPTTDVELMIPLINEVRDTLGITQDDIGFTCSGSSDFLAGQAFSFVMTLDAVGAVPPISESHVEMDGAWALYEAWVKMQMGEVDLALVYSYGKSSPGSLRDVLSTQLDPYMLAPLWPDAFALAGLQARLLLEQGLTSPTELAEIAVAARANAASNPHAVATDALSVDAIMAETPVADPLRPSDCATRADGGIAVILAADDRARSLVERPAWIRSIDHRIDTHQLGVRDLTQAPSAELAAAKSGAHDDKIDFAEIHGSFTTQQSILQRSLGLAGDVDVNPSGGPLVGDTLMATGLMRIAHGADRIASGQADRGIAHASAGPLLQQNLVCVLEGE